MGTKNCCLYNYVGVRTLDDLYTYLEVRLALLLDLVDGQLGASIAYDLGVGRVELIAEEGPDACEVRGIYI